MSGSQEPTWRADEPFTQSFGEWPIRFAAAAGKPFFPWQEGSCTAALACEVDGSFVHRSVVRIIPRQNGKNGEIEFIQIVKMLVLKRPLQVHSAHKMQTAREHFLRVKADIEELQKVDPSIRSLAIRFKDSDNDRAIICDDLGTRIQFLARATGGGRGFTGDDLYLDEALYLTPEMLGDILPASSAIPNAQIYYLSSHPKRHQEALLRMVRNGRAGTSRGTSYWEWGNEFHQTEKHPQGVDLASKAALLRANPSFGATIGDAAVGDERDKMTDDEFARERYGCIDVREDSAGWSVFTKAAWDELADPASRPGETFGMGMDMPPDMSTAVVARVSPRPDGRIHVELVRQDRNPDDWLDDWLTMGVQEMRPLGVGYESGSAISAPAKKMRRIRKRLVPLSNRDIGVATSLLQSKVRDKALVHLGDPVLDDALKAAQLGKLTERMFRLTKRNAVEDISPAIAVANALYVLETNGRPTLTTKRRGVGVMR